MRKFILVAAMLLASASAQAGVSRSLILAANDEVTPPAQPATTTTTAPASPATTPATTTPSTDTPKFVERPAVAPTATPAKTTTTGTPKTTKPVASDPKADKAKRRRDTEARVIYELHRHGIYW
jgi:hypothetical protein